MAVANQVTLVEAQLPAHNHSVDVDVISTISPNPHNHDWTGNDGTGWPDDSGDSTGAGSRYSYVRETKLKNVTLTVGNEITVNEVSVGSNQAHSNIQPSLAAYYIIHIP